MLSAIRARASGAAAMGSRAVSAVTANMAGTNSSLRFMSAVSCFFLSLHSLTAQASFCTQAAPTPITVAYGDGIGPEIMAASLKVLESAGAKLDIDVIQVGEAVSTVVFDRGFGYAVAPAGMTALAYNLKLAAAKGAPRYRVPQ